MEQIFNVILQNILTHMQAYGTALGLVMFTLLSNMPKPGVKWTKLVLYTWMYDTIQTVLPLNRGGHQIPQVPQLPSTSAEQTEHSANTVLPRYFK